MIQKPGSRLAVAAILLMLQSGIFVLELLVFARRVRRKPWYRPLRQLIGPVSIALLATILIPIMFINASDNVDAAAQQCNTGVDGDVAGQGVQIAVWAQVGVLLIISVVGSFHTSATGAKEVGAGLALTHVSLSIALLTQMARGTLSSADAVVGAMILDAQNIGMSIQLAAKETLASRWQVGVVVFSQSFGLAVIPLLIFKFLRGDFSNGDCRCLTVFWWARLSSCGRETTAAWEMSVFWTYYAYRCVCLCQSSFHSSYNTSKFDEAEKSERPEDSNSAWDGADEEEKLSRSLVHEAEQLSRGFDNQPGLPQTSGNNDDTDRNKYEIRKIRLRRVTHLYRRNNGQVVFYREYPATVTLIYVVYGVLSLTSMGTAQATVTNFNLKSSSPIESVGQIISLIVAAATLGRAAWLFLRLFRPRRPRRRDHHNLKNQRDKSGFVWPFRWKVVRNALLAHIEGDYVLCVLHNHEPSFLALGDILTEPFDVSSKVGAETHSAPGDVRSAAKSEMKLPAQILSRAPGFESRQRQELCARRIDKSWFDPEAASMESYITARLKTVHDPPSTVYMVTGIKVGHGITIYNQVSHNINFGFGPFQGSVGRESSSPAFESTREHVLFGYQLHIFRWSRSRGNFIEYGKYLAAEDW